MFPERVFAKTTRAQPWIFHISHTERKRHARENKDLSSARGGYLSFGSDVFRQRRREKSDTHVFACSRAALNMSETRDTTWNGHLFLEMPRFYGEVSFPDAHLFSRKRERKGEGGREGEKERRISAHKSAFRSNARELVTCLKMFFLKKLSLNRTKIITLHMFPVKRKRKRKKEIDTCFAVPPRVRQNSCESGSRVRREVKIYSSILREEEARVLQ